MTPARAGEASSGDIRVMALNMYHEARGEGRLGMLAVGWVVLNRMADKAFPKTVAEVIHQGCQFSWVCDGKSDRPRYDRSWRRALRLAAALLERPVADPTRGAMWVPCELGPRPPLRPSGREGSQHRPARLLQPNRAGGTDPIGGSATLR